MKTAQSKPHREPKRRCSQRNCSASWPFAITKLFTNLAYHSSVVKEKRDWFTLILAFACIALPLVVAAISSQKQRPLHPGMTLVLISAGVLMLLHESKRMKFWHSNAILGLIFFGGLVEAGIGWPYALVGGVLFGAASHVAVTWLTEGIVKRTIQQIEEKHARKLEEDIS